MTAPRDIIAQALSEIPPFGDVEFALRDASWFNYPDTSTIKQYHVVVGTVAACDRSMILAAETKRSDQISEGWRCQRSGCKSRWAAPVAPEPAVGPEPEEKP